MAHKSDKFILQVSGFSINLFNATGIMDTKTRSCHLMSRNVWFPNWTQWSVHLIMDWCARRIEPQSVPLLRLKCETGAVWGAILTKSQFYNLGKIALPQFGQSGVTLSHSRNHTCHCPRFASFTLCRHVIQWAGFDAPSQTLGGNKPNYWSACTRGSNENWLLDYHAHLLAGDPRF